MMNITDTVTLRLTPAPAPLEQLAARQHGEATAALMATLTGLLAESPAATVTLAASAKAGAVSLVVTVPADWQADVMQVLYTAFPAAVVEPVDSWRDAAAPISTVAAVQFTPEDAELHPADFAATDPLAGLFEALNTIAEPETAAAHLVLASLHTKSSLTAAAINGLGDLMLAGTRRALLGPAPKDGDKTASKSDDQSKADTAVLRANLYLTATGPAAEQLIRRLAASYHVFAVPGSTKLRHQLLPPGRGQTLAPNLRTGFLLTAPEAAALFHPPLNPSAYPRLATLPATRLPIPSELSEDGIVIGRGVHRDQRPAVHLAPVSRLRHTYIIGATGTGKSSLLRAAMLQDMQNGDGCCFIDPHGEEVEWLLDRIPPERARDVILFDPADPEALLGLNLLEWRTPEERDLLIQELIALFYRLFDPGHTGIIGPQFEHWLRSAALTVTEPEIRGTLVDIPRLFTDQAFQKSMVAQAHHPAVRDFWFGQMAATADYHKSEMLNYFTSKFGSFLGNSVMHQILSAPTSAFDLRAIMDRRKILLVNLSKGRLGSQNAQLLGTLIMAKLQLAALSRADVPADQRPPFYVYIDEFQNLVTDSFAAMLSEIRKYGVALHLAHQYVDQLPDSVKQAVAGNVGTLIAFRLGANDAHWLKDHFAPLTEADLTGLEPYHYHIRTLAAGQLTTPFTVAAPWADAPANPELAATIRGRVRRFVAAAGRS